MSTENQQIDFKNFCMKWEQQIFAKAILSRRLATEQQIKDAFQELSSPLSPQNSTLGQILVRNRVLSPVHFSQANKFVQQQLQTLYQNQKKTVSLQANRAPSSQEIRVPQPQQQQTTKTFGSYDQLEEIARGGMGVVYKARQMYLNRIVALKVLLSGAAATENEVKRFKREAEAAGSLQHPNIVSIYEIGEINNCHYFTMDYVDGETLQAQIKKKKKSKNKLIKHLKKVAEALHHAHEKKVIHRDVKPSNIIISKDGEPKVTDFGLAKKLDSETMLTETGAALGTPFYMSPEQTNGEGEIDHRADIYSMGVILYEILTNRYPFNGSTLVELYHKIVNDDPIPPRKLNKKIDKDIEIICLKCMEKIASMRYDTAADLAKDLDNYLEGEAISARRSSPVYRWSRKIKKNSKMIGIVLWGVVIFAAFVYLLFFGEVDFELYNIPAAERPQYLRARKHLQKGRELIQDHELEKAIKAFQQSIKEYSKMKDAYIRMGDIYYVFRDFPKAIQEYSRVLEFDKKYAPAYFRRGVSYAGLNKWTEAIEEFTKAIKHKPDYVEAYKERSTAYKERGEQTQISEDFEKSIQDYEKARELQEK